ncbi:odorant receptor 43a-like isoform X2 [Solenopsis invicta]|uniref:odorant receptor 43a-like isoform X2 n=1 Tax=Solenopsis invicta TaxID=13686 RepID=UPI00193CC700|nr:odorant receptor 43a-like isoform X2 [Solenopsis invicta]
MYLNMITYKNFLPNDYLDLEWAIGLHRGMLKIVGLWPQHNQDQYKEFLSKFRMLFNATIIICVLTIPALAQLMKVWGNMIQLLDNLQFSLSFLVTALKIFIMWYNKGALSLLIDMIVKDWMRVKMDEERNNMLKNARITRLFAKSGILITILAGLSRISSVFFKQYFGHVRNLTSFERSLPLPAYYWYDVSSSPKYELIYLAQAIGLFVCGLTYIAVDNFLGLLILHVCGQMENLYLRLFHLGKDPDFRAVLKCNVKDHIRLIRSVETIDDTFYLLLLGMICFFSILFSFYGFLVINAVNQNAHMSITQLASHISACISLLIHTCLYCAVGELLVIQCGKIHSATYECVWYTLEPKAARDLTLIMLCAKKPLNITAGKMFPMTMSTFCSLLKTSAGYVSVLLAARN